MSEDRDSPPRATADQIITVVTALMVASAPWIARLAHKHFFLLRTPAWLANTSWVQSIAAGLSFVLVVSVLKVRYRLKTRAVRVTDKPAGPLLKVYVAVLGEGEKAKWTRKAVIRAIGDVLNSADRQHVQVLRAGRQFSLDERLPPREAMAKTNAQARKFLLKHHGDLMVWGTASSESLGNLHPVELYLASTGYDVALGEETVFNSADRLVLTSAIGPEIGAAIAAHVLYKALSLDGDIYNLKFLLPAVDRIGDLLASFPPTARHEDRALLAFAYGLLEYQLGEQSGEHGRIEKAIESFRYASHNMPAGPPENGRPWAKNAAGSASIRLSLLKSDAAGLQEAITLLEEAASELSGDEAARIKVVGNLTQAMSTKGGIERDPEQLRGSIRKIKDLLESLGHKTAPVDRARIMGRLGETYRVLGFITEDTKDLESAIRELQNAASVLANASDLTLLSHTYNNLGLAIERYAILADKPELFASAVIVQSKALRCINQDHEPFSWALSQHNMATALRSAGLYEENAAYLQLAISGFQEAIEIFDRCDAQHYVEACRRDLELALTWFDEQKLPRPTRPSGIRTPYNREVPDEPESFPL